MVVLVMEVCVDSVESAIAFVGALPSPDNPSTTCRLTGFLSSP